MAGSNRGVAGGGTIGSNRGVAGGGISGSNRGVAGGGTTGSPVVIGAWLAVTLTQGALLVSIGAWLAVGPHTNLVLPPTLVIIGVWLAGAPLVAIGAWMAATHQLGSAPYV